jgi:hypothetical protein
LEGGKSFLAIQATRETGEEIRIQIYRTRVSAYEKTPLVDSFGHITLQKQARSKHKTGRSLEGLRKRFNRAKTQERREHKRVARNEFVATPELGIWGETRNATGEAGYKARRAFTAKRFSQP